MWKSSQYYEQIFLSISSFFNGLQISIFRKSAWEYNAERKQYYLHQFAIGQPDLNYRHPQVQEEMKVCVTFPFKQIRSDAALPTS